MGEAVDLAVGRSWVLHPLHKLSDNYRARPGLEYNLVSNFKLSHSQIPDPPPINVRQYIHAHCLKPLSIGVIFYATIDK